MSLPDFNKVKLTEEQWKDLRRFFGRPLASWEEGYQEPWLVVHPALQEMLIKDGMLAGSIRQEGAYEEER